MAEEIPEMGNKGNRRMTGRIGTSPMTEIAAGVVSGIWVVAVLAWTFTSADLDGHAVPR